MNKILIFILISLLAVNSIDIDQDIINKTIKQAQSNIWERYEDDHWNYPTYLGIMFTSVYYIELQSMGWLERSQFDVETHKKLVLQAQQPDGSWQQMPSENEGCSNIDASVMHYWFLKAIGMDINDEVMVKARNWIVSQGGIEAAQQMTRFKMSMHGQYDWASTYYIPLFIFDKEHPLSYFTYVKNIVAQWVYPHLTGFAYLRYYRLYKNTGPDLFELWASPPKDNKLNLEQRVAGPEPEEGLVKLVEEMMGITRPRGSIGTYTVSTFLNVFCLQHFVDSWPEHKHVPKIKQMIENGFAFIEENIFNKISPYTGQLDDGRWWDTLLAVWALQESGEDLQKLEPAFDKLEKDSLQENGGIAYGWEFEYVPDADDTSVYLTILGNQKNNQKHQKSVDRAIDFVRNFQNDDGGYAAFTKNLQGNWFYLTAFKVAQITCSAEIFDPSSSDITGHFLEAFATQGKDMTDPNVKKGIEFIEKSYTVFSDDFIAWEARWGINYIYGSGAIIPGLKRIGYNMKSDMIKKNIAWLVDKQNKDGGFGETHMSYNDPKLNGFGVSTPTQTAWALLALLDVVEYYDVQENIDKAISYLLQEFWEVNSGNWVDRTVVGTGHRKVIYLQYPSYSQTFPLVVLGRYRELVQNQKSTPLKINKNLQEKVEEVIKTNNLYKNKTNEL